MSDLFGNHTVCFPTRRLRLVSSREKQNLLRDFRLVVRLTGLLSHSSYFIVCHSQIYEEEYCSITEKKIENSVYRLIYDIGVCILENDADFHNS